MRVGIIGYGNMGQVHSDVLHVLAKSSEIEVTAVAEQKEELQQLAKTLWPDVAIYPEGSEMLETEVLDAVHICVPNYLHTRYTKQALSLGIPVFLEKPACLKRMEGQELSQAEADSVAWAAVGQVVRYFTEYEYLKHIYDERTYGELKSLRMSRRGERPAPWFLDGEKSGSVIMDLHIHDVDFIRHLLGTPEQIRVNRTHYPEGAANHIVARFGYGKNFVLAEAFWDVSSAAPFVAEYHACFEQGTVVYHNQKEKCLTVYRENGEVEHPDLNEEHVEEVNGRMPYYKEIKAFYQALFTGEKKDVVSLTDALETLEILWKEQEIPDKN